MDYSFSAVAAVCHDKDWDYNKKTKCGYTSMNDGFDYPVYTISWMTPSDATVTEEWKVNVCGWNEEYVIDWKGDEGDEFMKEVAKKNGEVTFFRIDYARRGVVCVDYNLREVYVEEVIGYNSVSYVIITPDGSVFNEC